MQSKKYNGPQIVNPKSIYIKSRWGYSLAGKAFRSQRKDHRFDSG